MAFSSEVFKDEQLRDEKILWTGQPETSVLFTGSDVFLIPFSLFFSGFALFFMYVVTAVGAPIYFIAWGIPFTLAGLYMLFGRFIYKNYRKRRTFYAVTDQRVLVVTLGRSRSVQTAFINQIPTINKAVRSDGIGTIRFGNVPMLFGAYLNSGMDFLGSFYGVDVPIFFDIAGAQEVYQLVNGIRKGER